jgi:hypothetical protein
MLLDLTAWILQGIQAMRAFGTAREPINLNDFKELFDQEDWIAIQHTISNLDHLTKIFLPPCAEPPLIYDHCTHRMVTDEANDCLTKVNYRCILMALDQSQHVVISHILNHLSSSMEKRDQNMGSQQEHKEEECSEAQTQRGC